MFDNLNMRKIIYTLIILIFELTNITNYCKAIDAPGYIINETQDTIFGTIKLHRINQLTGGVFIHGFDMQSLFNNVSFKSKTDKSYQTFSPNKILGFGFIHNSTDYAFKKFTLEYITWYKKKKLKPRFLNLIHQGGLNLYQDIIVIGNPAYNAYNEKYTTYYEYFLYNNSKGLVRVETSMQIKTMRDLLQQFSIDPKFIQEIPENTKFKDIKVVLGKYDQWISSQTASNRNINKLLKN